MGFRSLAGYAAPNDKAFSDAVENANSSSQSFYQGANASSSSSYSNNSSQSTGSGMPRAPAYAQNVPQFTAASMSNASGTSGGMQTSAAAAGVATGETASPGLVPAAVPSTPTSNSSSSMKQMPRAAVPPLEAVPFALRALVQVAVANHARLTRVWQEVCALLELVATQARAPPLRAFAVDAHRAMAHHLLNLHAQQTQSQGGDGGDDDAGATQEGSEGGDTVNSSAARPRASSDRSDLDDESGTTKQSSGRMSGSRGEGQLSVGWLVAGGLDGVLFEDLFAPPPPVPLDMSPLTEDKKSGDASKIALPRLSSSSVPLESLLEPLRALADRTDQVRHCSGGIPVLGSLFLCKLLQKYG